MIGGDSNSDGAVSPRNNSHKANGALSTSNLALITFLTDKMKAAKSNHDSVVCTILGTWLTELHLQEREIREEQNVRQQKRTGLSQPAAANKALLHQFLSSFVRDMDAKSIIKVLASHDISAGECAGYAAAAGDIGAAVNAALSGEDEKVSVMSMIGCLVLPFPLIISPSLKNGALDALRVLNDSPIEKSEPYYYRVSFVHFVRSPSLSLGRDVESVIAMFLPQYPLLILMYAPFSRLFSNFAYAQRWRNKSPTQVRIDSAVACSHVGSKKLCWTIHRRPK
jgi:hypothetical protein